MDCRYIVDPPQEGAWNMAVDEALLDDAAERGAATLRFYQWSEPTLSLGYFQAYAERETHAPSRGAAVVRRLSGGGALLHDGEVTYALGLPATHRLAGEATALYETVHRALVGVLGAWGLTPALYGDTAAPPDAPAEPFLCFARRSTADIVAPAATGSTAGAKIVGSAQRRRRGAVLQHGAVLVRTSAFAPEHPGLCELSGKTLDIDALIPPWREAIAAALDLHLRPGRVEGELREAAHGLRQARYGRDSWTKRR